MEGRGDGIGDSSGNLFGVPNTLSGGVGGLMGPWSGGVPASPSAPGEVSRARTGKAAGGALSPETEGARPPDLCLLTRC